MLIKIETPQVSATAAEALRYKKVEEKLGLIGKITLSSIRRRFISGSAGPERVVRETCGFSSFISVTAFVFPELEG